MSETPGKVYILGRSEVDGREVFVLQDLQCRRPDLVRRSREEARSAALFHPTSGRGALVPLRVAVTRD